MGADALELDVRLTRDGAVVVSHDPTLLRMTGDPRSVAACTLAELRALDAGSRFSADGGRTFPFAGSGVGMPALAEVLEEFPAVPLLIEVKEAAVALAAREVIARAGAIGRCVVAGFDAAALLPFREPPWLYGAATADAARLYLPAMLGVAPRATACRAFSVPVRWRGLPVPTRRFVRAAHGLGAAVHVWTVDDASLGRALWARGVNGVVTNRPDVMVAARAAHGGG
jgi:glycerophosphoryl diester phosphodiesterase